MQVLIGWTSYTIQSQKADSQIVHFVPCVPLFQQRTCSFVQRFRPRCQAIRAHWKERCFSAMKIVKTILRNRIRDGFLNDCTVCFVEQGFLTTIPIDDVIVRFHKMEDVVVEGHCKR